MKDLQTLKNELHGVNYKIERLTGKTDHTDEVAKHFHLGMVGGSGRNTHSLNKKREASLERQIKLSRELTPLYSRQSELERHIRLIESGELERRAERKVSRNELLAQWFKNLKPGDTFTPGNNTLTITKVNAKSISTGPGCKWTAAEVIGRDAAKLL